VNGVFFFILFLFKHVPLPL